MRVHLERDALATQLKLAMARRPTCFALTSDQEAQLSDAKNSAAPFHMLLSAPKPRNPRHFDTIEGGRVHQTLLGAIQYVKAIYRSKTTVADTFWRPGGD